MIDKEQLRDHPKYRIEAPLVCPNGELGHLVEMGPGILNCLNCEVDAGDD